MPKAVPEDGVRGGAAGAGGDPDGAGALFIFLYRKGNYDLIIRVFDRCSSVSSNT